MNGFSKPMNINPYHSPRLGGLTPLALGIAGSKRMHLPHRLSLEWRFSNISKPDPERYDIRHQLWALL